MNLLLPIALLATIPLRNPFWPIGYTGDREPIVDEPRVKTAAQTEEATEEDTKTSVTAEAIAAAEAEAGGAGIKKKKKKKRKTKKKNK